MLHLLLQLNVVLSHALGKLQSQEVLHFVQSIDLLDALVAASTKHSNET